MFYRNFHVNANSVDPDQMPHSAAFDLGLHCLPITLYILCFIEIPVFNAKQCRP